MINYEEWQLEDFMEEFQDEIENGEIQMERCKVAVCKTSPKDGDLSNWELNLDLIEVVETDDYNYQDEKVLLIDPNDNTKGFVVFEAIKADTLDMMMEYADYTPETIDPNLRDLDVDFYLTSNEYYCFG